MPEHTLDAHRGRMPVIFAGHGSPLHTIEDNRWSRGFAALARFVPRPDAVLAISAHWHVDGTHLTANERPPTLHDFSGFPQPLYEVDYPAPGHPDLAHRVRALIGEARADLTQEWGLDHGTWSVLRWMYPDANVPVIQLSMDRRLKPREHYELARPLTRLREEGVLVLASGNIVHNLPDAFGRMRSGDDSTPGWASRFDGGVRDALLEGDTEALLQMVETDDGRRAHPTVEHWLPLLYACGASFDGDAVRFPAEGFDLGSISMRNVVLG